MPRTYYARNDDVDIAYQVLGDGPVDLVFIEGAITGTLEDRMDDARTVMDAVGSERAAFLGVSEGGPMSILFAATYPDRTQALILCGAEVRERQDDEWPWGESTDVRFE